MFSFIYKKFYLSINILFITLLFFNLTSSKLFSDLLQSSTQCSIGNYDNTSITEECISGLKKNYRVLNYRTFELFYSSNNYKHNGLPFYASFYVDTDFHNFWDFMDGGMVIIILLSVSLIFLIAWIPMICCWKYRCCLFDECCTESKCCFIYWNLFAYILFAAILSCLIVCIFFSL